MSYGRASWKYPGWRSAAGAHGFTAQGLSGIYRAPGETRPRPNQMVVSAVPRLGRLGAPTFEHRTFTPGAAQQAAAATASNSSSAPSSSAPASTAPVYSGAPARQWLPAGASPFQGGQNGPAPWTYQTQPPQINTASASMPTTPVPASYPTNEIYIDSSGNQWEYIDGQWENISTIAATISSAGSVTSTTTSTYPGTPVPLTYPTSSTYIDSSGNTWTWNGSSWAISTTAAGVSTTTVSGWLSAATMISGVPNYVVLGGGLVLLGLMFKKR